MKILVVSDTHRYQGNFYELLETLDDIDYVIHCGDVEGCEDEMESVCDVPFVAVAGNNDWCSFLPRERVLELCGHRIFVTHGHLYNVSSGLWRIIDEAKDRECDIALFGHTHRPTYSTD
ncbi:MAG: YfcE family phosphodiesterase, partial [Lachnospiraceae bacterium]|nr:YfcE family phosphodiesterase [Lachnospiraceae bacterium]